jgi:hypothetical protein
MYIILRSIHTASILAANVPASSGNFLVTFYCEPANIGGPRFVPFAGQFLGFVYYALVSISFLTRAPSKQVPIGPLRVPKVPIWQSPPPPLQSTPSLAVTRHTHEVVEGVRPPPPPPPKHTPSPSNTSTSRREPVVTKVSHQRGQTGISSVTKVSHQRGQAGRGSVTKSVTHLASLHHNRTG